MRLALAPAVLAAGLVVASGPESAAQPPAGVVKVGGLSAPAPAGWVSEKPKYTLRSYQFVVPGPEKDGPAGEFIVMPDSDPKAEKVFARWRAQFVAPDGKTDDLGKVSKLSAPGATVDVLDVTGTWRYRERPFDPKSKEELREEYRVVWAVVVDKADATHLRLSGPKDLIDKQYPAFEAFLKGLK